MTKIELKSALANRTKEVKDLMEEINSLRYKLEVQKEKTTEAIFEAGLLHRIMRATLVEISDR